ncbi:unnamed protein product [Effrenium voratum]|uniref:Uncharacterized protein n=1 Tax=Effrenium voratum TaxID=2562239 RepID=A0AA36MIB7_9DINO|nr:unnamed protein product [Effrenium voratum]
MHGHGGSLQNHGSFSAGGAWPPQSPQVGVAAPQDNELANKAAEVTVLRSRLQHFEKENTRLQNELACAKEAPDKKRAERQERQELERVSGELQYARQDLLSSEEERKRMRLTLETMQKEMIALRKEQPERGPIAPAAAPAAPTAPAVATAAPPTPRVPAPAPAEARRPKEPPVERRLKHETSFADESVQAKRSLLLEALARWEVLAPEGPWLQLRAALAANAAASAANAFAALAQCGGWAARSAAAQAARAWALETERLGELCLAERQTLPAALCGLLQKAVLEPEEDEHCENCASETMAALCEVAAKLRPAERPALRPALAAPGALCALLCEEVGPDSLHLPCLSFLQTCMACPELFALAHQAPEENLLLAAAELLVVPSRDSEVDSLERQQCRVAALRLFVQCLATAPSPDAILQLRGDGCDTVLQRLVLLGHHELMCLTLASNPWHSFQLEASCTLRRQAAETSLLLLSSFAWRSVPEAPSLPPAEYQQLRLRALALLGRTRILLPSIIDLVASRASEPEYHALLGSASLLRLLDDPEDSKGSVAAR